MSTTLGDDKLPGAKVVFVLNIFWTWLMHLAVCRAGQKYRSTQFLSFLQRPVTQALCQEMGQY